MSLSKLSPLTLPASFDAHVHVRDGAMSHAVVPTIRSGGCDTVYIMPNLTPPVTTPQMALDYQARLKAIDPSIRYLMTLYLHPTITPAMVYEASKLGISGIKSYPAGVTTNSASGVLDYETFYPVFEAMQECGMVLNLHGECPSNHSHNAAEQITILNAEAKFLPTLKSIHAKFPRLKIVLEHCTTAAAVEAVRACGPNVVGTITAHHLWIVIDDWADDAFNYCKPVAKLPTDRSALLRAVIESGINGKFFLGTDSAPHDIRAKKGGIKTSAGVFTQPYATQLVIGALEEAISKGIVEEAEVTVELLRGFMGELGRKFYGIEESKEKITLVKGVEVVMESLKGDGVEVVPFRRGKNTWSIEWTK